MDIYILQMSWKWTPFGTSYELIDGSGLHSCVPLLRNTCVYLKHKLPQLLHDITQY